MKTVKDLAQERYPGETFDFALPYPWLRSCLDKGLDPRGHVCWLYDDAGGGMGRWHGQCRSWLLPTASLARSEAEGHLCL